MRNQQMSPKKSDLSHKDYKYFINGKTYNCPFCKQGSVGYTIEEHGSFDIEGDQTVYYYIIKCMDEECDKKSFHLSEYELRIDYKNFFFPPMEKAAYRPGPYPLHSSIIDEKGNSRELDDVFFHSMPTGAFTIDSRIPKKIRLPLIEADNCLKSGFLTGASACLRKSIYKLLKDKKIPEKNDKGELYKYDERLSLLQRKFPHISAPLFTSLKRVLTLTSKEVHENDWEDFDSKKLRLLIFTTKEILKAIYVTPAEEEKRLSHLLELVQEANLSTDEI